MKTRNSSLNPILLIQGIAIASVGLAAAQSISVNFGSDRRTVDSATTSAGAVDVLGDNWNEASGANDTLNSLIDDSGTATGASVTWTSNNTYFSSSTGGTATSENGDLTRGYLDDGGVGWAITLNSPYLLNDIYVMHATDNAGTMAAVSVNGTYYKGDAAGSTILASGASDTWVASPWSDADTLVESDNYLKIENQASVVLAADRNSARAALAGLQVVNAYSGTLSYWDTDGVTAGAGGATPTGNWADSNWSASDLGTAAASTWTSGNAAVFSAGSDATGAYTVTLAGTQTADAVWVQTGDVTLTGGTLALGSTGLLRNDGTGLTVDSALTATDLTMTGAVNLNNAANAITGLVTVSGTTTLGAAHSFNQLAGAGTLAIGANALSVGDATDSTFNGTLTGSGALTKTGAGQLTLGSTQTGFTGSAAISAGTLALPSGDLNWDVSGAGNLTKTGGGQLNILSDVTNTGTVTVEGGILQVGNVGAVGSFGTASNLTLNTAGLALRYRLSGADATLSSDVTFGHANAEIRQHAGTDADKLTITGTVGANTDDGILSVNGGDMIIASGAVVNVREVRLVGPTAGDRGTLVVEAGATLDAGYLNIGNGNGQSGIINQTGGTVTMASGGTGIRIGHWNNGSDVQGSEYNISGGTLDASNSRVSVGWDGKGTLNISGAAVVKAGRLDVDESGADRPGIVNLDSGRLEVGTGGITFDGTAGSAINLGGGTLAAVGTSNWGALVNANTGTTSSIEVGAGLTATQSQVVQGDGNITKTGTGTLVLSNAANTHTGTIKIEAGTLALGATGSIASSQTIDVQSGAILDGSAVTSFQIGNGQTLMGAGSVVGDIQAALGSTISVGASPGTLTFDGNLLVGGATMIIELTGTGAGLFDVIDGDTVNIGNTLTINGGTLELDTTGYTATLADSFVIFENWSSMDGGSGFDLITGTDLGGGLEFDTSNLYTTGTLLVIAVPEPSSAALLALGGLALILRRRK